MIKKLWFKVPVYYRGLLFVGLLMLAYSILMMAL